MASLTLKNSEQGKRNTIFLIWLLLIMLCWILGTKVSEMLLDHVVDLSFNELQLAESLFSYTIAITIFFWGFLVDRYNNKRKIILVLSSILWIIASFLLFFIPIEFYSYCAIQVLWGLSFGASGPLIASYLGDIFRIENRGKLFSLFTIFIYLIKGSNIAINGIIGETTGNWRTPTFIFAFLGIFIVIFFYFFVKEPSIALNEPEFQEKKAFVYNYHLNLNDVKLILSNKTNALFLLQGIFGMVGVTIVTKYMSYWFTSAQYDGLDINIGLAVILLGVGGALGGLSGILLVGRWIDAQFRKGKIEKILLFAIICVFSQAILYAFLILAIQYPSSVDGDINNLLIFLTMYPAFIGFILVFNACVFCGTPVGTTVGVARTHVNLPEHRGTAGALYDLTDFIGAGIGIMVGTLLMASFASYRLTIVYGALFWLISGVVWVVAAKFIKKDYEKTRQLLKSRAK